MIEAPSFVFIAFFVFVMVVLVYLAFNGGNPGNSPLVGSVLFAIIGLYAMNLELRGSDNRWLIITILSIALIAIYLYLFMRLNPGVRGYIRSFFRSARKV